MEDHVKLKFTTDATLNLATGDGPVTYDFKAGETATVPADIAAMFISAGQAEPVAAEKATKAKGETATK
jgi:hypothetical protein